MRYNVNQSPLYNINSKRRLVEVLGSELSLLNYLSKKANDNYKQYRAENNRWIESSKTKLKKIQKRLHDLMGRIEAPEYIFSGFKGRSAVDNAKKHAGSVCMVKMDIRKFYPSVNGRRVQEFFVDKMQCAPDVAGILKDLTTIGKTNNALRSHLPTGGVTSPILSYYCFKDMFDELDDLARKEDLIFTVLADDLTFSGRQIRPSLLKDVRDIIKRYELQSHWRKEKLWTKKHAKMVTGVVITSKGCRIPNSKRKIITDLRIQLDQDLSVKEKVVVYRKLTGLLSWASTVEPKYKIMNEITYSKWRKDKQAWLIHCQSSGQRKKCH